MNVRLRTRLTTLLAAALLSHQAAAIEEVVVYGADLSTHAASIEERIYTAMREFLTELNAQQKSKLDADLAKIGERGIQIAAAKIPTRG